MTKIARMTLLFLIFDFGKLNSRAEITNVTTVPFQVFLVQKDAEDVASVECTLEEKDFLAHALETIIPKTVMALKSVDTEQFTLDKNVTEIIVDSSEINLKLGNVSMNQSTFHPTSMPTIRRTPIPTSRPTRLPSLRPTKLPTWRPTMSPTNLPTLPVSKQPTIQSTNRTTNSPTTPPSFIPIRLPTPLPTKSPITAQPTLSSTKFPTQQPTLVPTPASSRRLYNTFTQRARHLAVAKFVWGGSSSWTCRGCPLDINDNTLYFPGMDVILDLIYGIRGPFRSEKLVTENITAVMQAEIGKRLNISNITVGCLRNSTFSTFYKDLTIPSI
jgi:hypothetical protein